MINEKKKEIKESEEKYKKLFEHSMDAAYITTPEGKIIDINRAGLELFGFSRDEFLKLNVPDLYMDPNVREKAKKILEKQGFIRDFECKFYRKNKTQIAVRESCIAVRDEKGKIIMYYGILKDITKQKRLEEKLSAIYNLSREMSLSLDLDQISKIVLDTAEKVLNFGNIDLFLVNEDTNELHLKECRGLKESEMDTIIPIFGKEGITAHVARTGESLNIPDVRKDERYLFGLKGSRSELCVPIKIKDKVMGVLDVESKELNAFSEEDQRLLETLASQAAIAIENARLLETIKKSSELQKLFVSILSHDLKNPLTVIKGYTYLIKRNADEKVKIYIREMQKSIEKMNILIANAKLYSQLKEKAYKKEFERRYLEDIIKETLRDLEKKAKEKNIDTAYKAEGTYPVNANSTLEDVFLNLIDNAIKYSPENGKVEIDIEDKVDKWRTSVKDWGEGVPDELKEAIFERFERGDVDVKGSGLGLAIVKQIVDMHEGKVWVEDNPEGGSIFFVEIPKMRE